LQKQTQILKIKETGNDVVGWVLCVLKRNNDHLKSKACFKNIYGFYYNIITIITCLDQRSNFDKGDLFFRLVK